MKVGCYVTVDGGDNYVTFHELNLRIKIKTVTKAQLDSVVLVNVSFNARFKPHCGLVKPRSRRLGGFLLCLRFIFFFFSFVGEQTQTPGPLGQLLSPNDVTISQLQAISQLFSSYPSSGAFCQVSKLTIQKEHGSL